MPSISNTIQNKTVHAAVDLTRYEATERARIRVELEKMRRTLVLELADSRLSEFTKARLNSTLAAANNAIKSTYSGIASDHTASMTELARIQASVAENIINASVGVVLVESTFDAAQLSRIASNVLIEGAPSAEWWARAEKATRQRFADNIRQGMLRGDTIDTMVRNFKDNVMAKSTREAEAIVRTSVITTSNVIRQDVYKENADLFTGIQWVSTLDDRTTEECMALDGCEWDMDYNPIDDAPPFPGATAHWGCRSTQVPILKSWAELAKDAKGNADLAAKLDQIEEDVPGMRAMMDGETPATQTYEDWLAEQPEALQKEILGPGKWELWDGGNGDLSLREMIDQSGNPLTLAQLEARSVAVAADLYPAVSERTREFAYKLLEQGTKIEDVIAALQKEFPDEKNVRGIALQYRKEFRAIAKGLDPHAPPVPKAPAVPKLPAKWQIPVERTAAAKDILPEQIQGYQEAMRTSPSYAKAIIEEAQRFGFPLRNIRFEAGAGHSFQLNDASARAFAWAEVHTTGDIVFPIKEWSQASYAFTRSTAAHEITHVRWERIFRAYEAERAELRHLTSKMGIEWSAVVDLKTNLVREPYASHFPFIKELDRFLQDINALQRDDGTTSYSKDVWASYVNRRGSTLASAIHETLAEIASVNSMRTMGLSSYRGRLLSEQTPAAIWQEFVNATNRLWSQTPVLQDGLNSYQTSLVRFARNTKFPIGGP